MTASKSFRALTLAACLISLHPTLALAGKYGSFRAPSVSIKPPPSAPKFTAPAPSAGPTSGGYSSFRNERAPSVAPVAKPVLTGSDRDISRQSSGNALSEMRRQDAVTQQRRQDAASTSTAPTTPSGSSGTFSKPTWTRPEVTERTPRLSQPQWQRQPDWNIPGYAQPQQSYGDLNPLLLWALISSLNRPGSSDFFHNHRDDPGYRQWRAEAERQAKTNEDLRNKLDDLDRKLAETKDKPVDASYIPPGIDPKIAHATQPVSGGHGWLLTLLILLILGGTAVFAWHEWTRRHRNRKGVEPMSRIDVAKDYLQDRLGGTPKPAPSRFKIGQVIRLERTPFILASESKIVAPASASGTTSLVKIGTLSGGTELQRLYFDEVNFLQVHMSEDIITDCRYFSRIDEEYPNSADEWRVWLDPVNGWTDLQYGILSDPKFRTPDEALYDRVWTPGDNRVPPRDMQEIIRDPKGERIARITAQLYARPMPGEETKREYLLVEVREESGSASVIIYAGIDLDPAAVGL